MSKLMIRIIMSLGAILLSTAPISQTFAQVKQQEAQASGIAVADTLSNSSAESDNLQLLRPDATTIFPKGDSVPVADSAAAIPPPAALSTGATVAIVVLVVAVALGVLLLISYCQSLDNGC